jgi:hypothetical protein
MTVTQCLLQLVNNPRTLKCLVEEIDRAFPFKNEDITFAKTQDLQYVNAVIYEAMRLGVHPASMWIFSPIAQDIADIFFYSDDAILRKSHSP